MATAQGNGQTPREELERVLSSRCFARSEGLSRLLRFLVERQLEGRGSEIKESLIGVEVYGRSPDYDPKVDSTVRSEMARLRARLSKYYLTEGSQDPFVIELPKGSYVPIFRHPEPVPVFQRAAQTSCAGSLPGRFRSGSDSPRRVVGSEQRRPNPDCRSPAGEFEP